MAHCGCRDSCSCLIRSGSDNVSIVGTGGNASPYIISVTSTGTDGGGEPGVSDHGLLTGLEDDDHPQYALVADAVPLSSTAPLGGTQNGAAGTANTAARGDHRHPLPTIAPTILKGELGWTTPHHPSGNATMTTGTVVWMPYFLSRVNNSPIAIDRIGVQVNTAGTADATLQVGFYSHNASTDRPDARLLQATFPAGTLDSTGGKEVTVSYTFPSSPIMVWVAVLPLGTSAAVFRGIDKRTYPVPIVEGTQNPDRGGFRLDSQTVLPASASFTAWANDPGAHVLVRLA